MNTLIYAAISAVSGELAHTGISKDRKNEQQHYKFRGIDDCLNALAPLLAQHRLVILPEVLERSMTERESKSGGVLFSVVVKVRYSFVCTEDGSRHDVVVYGEAMDSADKATNKAMSAAYKYAVIQTFCIPTEGDNDADATTPTPGNLASAIPAPPRKPAPKPEPKPAPKPEPIETPLRDGIDELEGLMDGVQPDEYDEAGAPVHQFAFGFGLCNGKSPAEVAYKQLTWYRNNYWERLQREPESRFAPEWQAGVHACDRELAYRDRAASANQR